MLTKPDKSTQKNWFARRTIPEYGLFVFSLGLVGVIIALLRGLAEETAPFETVWGNVADWVGVVVTFLGFVGAIMALLVQARALSIQHDERQDKLQTRAEQKIAEEAELERRKEEKRTEFARSVGFDVTARHDPGLPGHKRASDGQLSFVCRADFPSDAAAPYTDCRLLVPDPRPAEITKFEETIARVHEDKLGAHGHRTNLTWRVAGEGWFDGDDQKALSWLIPLVGVEFTDPDGVRWRINGDKKITQV